MMLGYVTCSEKNGFKIQDSQLVMRRPSTRSDQPRGIIYPPVLKSLRKKMFLHPRRPSPVHRLHNFLIITSASSAPESNRVRDCHAETGSTLNYSFISMSFLPAPPDLAWSLPRPSTSEMVLPSNHVVLAVARPDVASISSLHVHFSPVRSAARSPRSSRSPPPIQLHLHQHLHARVALLHLLF